VNAVYLYIVGANVLNLKLFTITCIFSEPRTQRSPPLTFTTCEYVARTTIKCLLMEAVGVLAEIGLYHSYGWWINKTIDKRIKQRKKIHA